MEAERHQAISRAVHEEFSVKTMLNISLVKAKGLKSSQKGKLGFSCTCQLEGRPYTLLKSEPVSSLNPVWNYTGMIDGCVSGDALELRVISDGKVPDECLGYALLPYDEFHPDGFSGEVPFDGAASKRPPTFEVKVEVLPVPITTPKELRAFVSFLGAEGLPGENDSDVNPYCVCEIAGKSDSKVRSKICLESRNPEWNELHEVDDYEAGDDLNLSVFSSIDGTSKGLLLGTAVLPSSAFHSRGFAGAVTIRQGEDVTGEVGVCIDIGGPSTDPNGRLSAEEEASRTRRAGSGGSESMLRLENGSMGSAGSAGGRRPRRVNAGEAVSASHYRPADQVGPDDRKPVPFQLRSLETNRVHRLCAYTVIGRSKSFLDPKFDLILDSPGICDVSRVHAVIKAWPGADGRAWFAQLFDDKNDRGYFFDEEGCRVLVGGGTFVNGQPVEHASGVDVGVGAVLRFGVNELWVLESAPLHQRLRAAELACRQAQDAEDPESIRELCVPTPSCDSALKRCVDWISIVRVVLEALHQPDEAPCADVIEVKDESGRPVSRHLASTLEQQEAYDVKHILQDVRLGTTVRLRLSSDPCLLAPVLGHLAQVKERVAETFRSRADVLG